VVQQCPDLLIALDSGLKETHCTAGYYAEALFVRDAIDNARNQSVMGRSQEAAQSLSTVTSA